MAITFKEFIEKAVEKNPTIQPLHRYLYNTGSNIDTFFTFKETILAPLQMLEQHLVAQNLRHVEFPVFSEKEDKKIERAMATYLDIIVAGSFIYDSNAVESLGECFRVFSEFAYNQRNMTSPSAAFFKTVLQKLLAKTNIPVSAIALDKILQSFVKYFQGGVVFNGLDNNALLDGVLQKILRQHIPTAQAASILLSLGKLSSLSKKNEFSLKYCEALLPLAIQGNPDIEMIFMSMKGAALISVNGQKMGISKANLTRLIDIAIEKFGSRKEEPNDKLGKMIFLKNLAALQCSEIGDRASNLLSNLSTEAVLSEQFIARLNKIKEAMNPLPRYSSSELIIFSGQRAAEKRKAPEEHPVEKRVKPLVPVFTKPQELQDFRKILEKQKQAYSSSVKEKESLNKLFKLLYGKTDTSEISHLYKQVLAPLQLLKNCSLPPIYFRYNEDQIFFDSILKYLNRPALLEDTWLLDNLEQYFHYLGHLVSKVNTMMLAFSQEKFSQIFYLIREKKINLNARIAINILFLFSRVMKTGTIVRVKQDELEYILQLMSSDNKLLKADILTAIDSLKIFTKRISDISLNKQNSEMLLAKILLQPDLAPNELHFALTSLWDIAKLTDTKLVVSRDTFDKLAAASTAKEQHPVIHKWLAQVEISEEVELLRSQQSRVKRSG
jgi:hypothetical protein